MLLSKKKRTPAFFKSNRSLSGSERSRSKSLISWVISCSSNSKQEISSRLEREPELAFHQDDYTGQTCLHWMVKHNNKELVEILMENMKVSPDLKNKNGQTSLHLAALYDRRELYYLLKNKYKADSKIRDNSGRLASYYLDNLLTGPSYTDRDQPAETNSNPASSCSTTRTVSYPAISCSRAISNPVISCSTTTADKQQHKPAVMVYGPNSKGLKLSWHLLALDLQEIHSKTLTSFGISHHKGQEQRMRRRGSEDWSGQFGGGGRGDQEGGGGGGNRGVPQARRKSLTRLM